MPVSRTATVIPSPVIPSGQFSAPMACTPQLTCGSCAEEAEASATGSISRVGMGGATTNTAGSRCTSASSRGVGRFARTTCKSSGERSWLLTRTRGPLDTGRVDRRMRYSIACVPPEYMISAGGEEDRAWQQGVAEGAQGLADELQGRPPEPFARLQDRQQHFLGACPHRGAVAAPDLAVHHRRTDRLLHLPVGRLYPGVI